MNMRYLLLWIYVSLIFCTNAFSQDNSGIVSGLITTSDNQPAAAVPVALKGSSKTTVSDEKGSFTIRKLAAGNYTLEIALPGFEKISQAVTVGKNQTIRLNIQLQLSERTLQEVTITGGGRLGNSGSDYIAKLPLKNLENPQVYHVIPKELMKEQLTTDFQSALQNTPGGAVMQNPDRSIFVMLRGFEAYGLLRNGVSAGQIFDNIDPVNLERIEILKGPSATLFGSSIISYGGTINRVTKKPYDHFGGEIGYSAGQWDLSRFTLDVNTPLNADKTALLRVNAASHQEGSFQDAGAQSSWTVAPSLSYQVTKRLTLTLDAEMSKNNSAPLYESGFGLDNLTGKKYSDVKIPYNSSLTGNDIKDHIGSQNIYAGATYQLSDNWTSQTLYSYNQQTKDAYNMVFLNFVNDSILDRTVYATRSGRITSSDLQQNFTGRFATGSIHHRLLVGLDYYDYHLNYPFAFVNYDEINFTHPGNANMSLQRVNDSISVAGLGSTVVNQHTLAAYAADVVNITSNLIAMISARVDYFSSPGSYHQTSVSPKFGLIYQVVPDRISLFANYMNGFQNQSGADFVNKAFKPQQANQIEGGAKLDLVAGKLSGTLTYYNIEVKNMLRTDPLHPSFSIQDATQRSKGFEAELIANPVKGLNIVAGYGYNDNAYEKADPSLQGKRPIESPWNTLNWWFSYKLQQSALKGLTIGFGGNYVSEMFSYFDTDNHIPLPAYTILRATILYDQPRYSIGLKVNNLTGQKYWNTNGQAQAPTQVTGTVTCKF